MKHSIGFKLLWIGWIAIAGFSPWVSADRGYDLIQAPVQDAQTAFEQGVLEFVGIQLQKELRTPGLKPQQRKVVDETYRIRPLNRRWKTFSNVEQDRSKMRDLTLYANRFNIKMWQLIERQQRQATRQYRY